MYLPANYSGSHKMLHLKILKMKIVSIKRFLFLIASCAALSGCLKDDAYNDGSIQSLRNNNASKLIEIGLTATNTRNFLTISLPGSNADTSFALIPVNLSSNEPAQEDINIMLVKNDAAIAAYNAANGTAFTIPAATMYTIENPGNVVTIAKGSYTGYLRIRLKPSDFLGGDWALGYSLSSADKQGYVLSSNLNTGIVRIAVQNQYEASYRAVGFFQHPTLPRNYDRIKYLATIDANTVEMELGDLGAATTIFVTVNPNNTVTIAPGPGATPNTAAVSGDATYNNTYDPTTQTFRLKYSYTTSAPRTITEIVTRR